jgi:signal transduction histidine kinase
MAKNENLLQNPGIMLVISYTVLLLVSALVIVLGNMVAPAQVVLGTVTIPFAWAVFHAAGKVALVATLFIPFVNEYERQRGKALTSTDWMGIYFVINFVTLWLITRVPDQFGLGVSSWVIVAALSLALTVVQGIAMMQFEKSRQK